MIGFGALSMGAGHVAGAESPDTRTMADQLRASDPTQKKGLEDVVPVPVETTASDVEFALTSDTEIYAESVDALGVARYLAELLRPATGYELPVSTTTPNETDSITLSLAGVSSDLGSEGYELTVAADAVELAANEPAGLFNGVQTFRQLLPASIESTVERPGPWVVPGGNVRDYPRFEYRSALLDVAREFYPVEAVKRYVDELVQYKINHLHLHLTDDSGWRVMIESWPKLATYGGQTDRDGGEGGYYTKDEYEEIVRYARDRNVTIVPEIDMPGHSAAALASYPELACPGESWYIGNTFHESSLCVDRATTYEFVDDVIRELAEMTPGPYIHIGGDEAEGTSDDEYATFFDRVLPMVAKYGKRAIGWHQIVQRAGIPNSAVCQYWGPDRSAPAVQRAAQQGSEVIASPATHTYISRNYTGDPFPSLGALWGGVLELKDTYTWDPGSYVDGISESSVLGPETCLWGESLESRTDVDLLTFPRLLSFAELGWSPKSRTDWDSFTRRLAGQAARWVEMDVDHYRVPQIDWPSTDAIALRGFEVDGPLLVGETRQLDVTMANWGDRPNTITLSLDGPEGWQTTSATAELGARETGSVAIDVTPSSARANHVPFSAVVETASAAVVGRRTQLVETSVAVDDSESNYTGVVRGSPDVTTTGAGNGVALDGRDDAIEPNGVGAAPALNFTEPGFTVEARVWIPEITSRIPIFSKGDRQYQLQIRGPQAGKRPAFAIYDDTWHSATSHPPAEGWEQNWHTLAGVCTASAIKLYVDGELIDETPHSVSALNEAPYQAAVGYNAQLDSFANATVAYVHVYGRALSGVELPTTRDGPPSDAVLWYDFDVGNARFDGDRPTDPDGDGDFEDLTGDGRLTEDDVRAYAERIDDPAFRARTEKFDYNENGRIDHADLVSLFDELQTGI